MEIKRFKPKTDRLFWFIWITLSLTMILITAFSFFDTLAFLIMLSVDVFTFYFLFSTLSGYVELKEHSLFIKFGFIIKREIPYGKIRGISKERRLWSESMLSLKNAIEHVNIKYNTFDVTTVSVVDNDEFIKELELRISC